MIFIYPYKRKDNDFLIIHSIRCVKKVYPDARCITVGDKVDNVENIPFKDSSNIRGVNVTAKILYVAQFFDEFVYMNDDFFINENYKLNEVYCFNENALEQKPGKASIEWNTSVDNTKHWLEYNDYPVWSYECHQPVVFNSQKLFATFDKLNWKAEHFLKSIYFNVNEPEHVLLMDNVKLIEPNIAKAKYYLSEFGCFSVGLGFLNGNGINFIKELCE